MRQFALGVVACALGSAGLVWLGRRWVESDWPSAKAFNRVSWMVVHGQSDVGWQDLRDLHYAYQRQKQLAS